MNRMCVNFFHLKYCLSGIAVAYGHLSTALNLCTSSQEGDNAEINKYVQLKLIKIKFQTQIFNISVFIS